MKLAALTCVLALCGGPAVAQDDPLTPVGAQRAGNAEGSIPEWTGAPTPGNPRDPLRDPFADDQPLFAITSRNWRDHARYLSAGHQALFAQHADYTMPVYPTRRSAIFPDAIYAATAANRERANLQGVDAIAGAQLGIPFPEPRNGVEVLWNHRLRYRGDSAEWHYQRASVIDGHAELGRALERGLFGYATLRRGRMPADMHSYTFLHMRPASPYPDITAVWHDAVNPLESPRKIWSGTASGRKYRNPPLGYDQVGLFTYLIRYFDMVDMFSGAFDRYTFKLLGRQERYVPYNSFRLARAGAPAIGPSHLDGADARYELHRVWVVEATLRPDEQHSLRRRVFYVDEDSWSIVLADCYGAGGVLDRFQEGHLLPLTAIRAVEYAPVVTYDLPGKRYFVDRLVADSPRPKFNLAELSPEDFVPSVVTRTYRLP